MAMQAMQNSVTFPRPWARDVIVSSWMRCRAYGLAPHAQMRESILHGSQLALERERNQQLRHLASQEMKARRGDLVEAGCIMLLADAQGLVLDAEGDADFMGRASQALLMPGASWREQVAGTNAIGTAIAEDGFVQIIGSQHFFAEHRALACSSMPIHSPAGVLAGALDVSGRAHESAEPAARLVQNAVAHIEHRWATESATDLVVHLHRYPERLGTADEGLLLFEDDLLTGANSRALALLNLTPASIRNTIWDDLFGQRPAPGLQELQPMAGRGLLYADVVRAGVVAG